MKNKNLNKISIMLSVVMLAVAITGCGVSEGAAPKDIDKVETKEELGGVAVHDTANKLDADKDETAETTDKKIEDVSSKNEAKSETINKPTNEHVKESSENSESSIKNETKFETVIESTKETVKESTKNNTSSNENSNKIESSSNKKEENKNNSSSNNKAPTETNKQPTKKPNKEETNKPSAENKKPVHTHTWVEVTEKYTIPAKTHEEVIYKTERYEIEPAKDVKELVFSGQECVDCGYRTSVFEEMDEHMLEAGHSCTIVDEYETVHYDAVYGERKVPNGVKVVVDEPEKTGTRVMGYKCSSCNATKNK